jgi:hypothetical protein
MERQKAKDANLDQNKVVNPNKYRNAKCRYTHSKPICKSNNLNKKCEIKDFGDRHPAVFKWFNKKGGCKRNS